MALNYSSSDMQEKHPGGKGAGHSARKTRRRMERERKEREETHAMDKPKPLEVVSDGDLSEVKKDPVWKTWLGKKRDWDAEDKEHKEMMRPIKCTNCGKTKPRILFENPAGIKAGTCDDCFMNPKDSGLLDRLAEGPSMSDEEIADWEREQRGEYDTKKSWEVWLDNITKPIPDSKGGRGSFQHCIDTNQDKNNPGGWCKQIERKIGGDKKKDGGMAGGTGSTYEEGESKDSETQDHVRTGFAQNTQYPKKGKDEGEKEEVKISMYEKLRRIKDKLEAHNKARPRTTGSGFGKAKNKRPPIKGISAYQQGPKKMEVTSPHGKGQQTGGKETGEGWQKYWDEHKDELLDYEKKKEKKKIAEKPESDYYMDAGGNPQRKEKATKKKKPKKEEYDLMRQVAEMMASVSPYSRLPTRSGGTGTLKPGKTSKPRRATQEEINEETKEYPMYKADYFVEEIRSNIIYHNKIFPLIGMVAGQAARGMGKLGKKVGGEILEGAGELSQGVMQEAQEEEEQ